MKRLSLTALILTLFTLPSLAQISVSGTVATPRTAVNVTYSDYYKVEPKVVEGLVAQKVSDDDISVALFLSNHAKVTPEILIGYRTKGLSWADITIKIGVKPDVFFVVLPANPGPPYGKAWGHWKKRKAHPGLVFDLGDDDLRNLVQLRLVSEHYKVKPAEVIKWRGSGKAFDMIISDEHGKKHGHGKPADEDKVSPGKDKKGSNETSDKSGKGHGKGKGN
jgi:hypothetical protein